MASDCKALQQDASHRPPRSATAPDSSWPKAATTAGLSQAPEAWPERSKRPALPRGCLSQPVRHRAWPRRERGQDHRAHQAAVAADLCHRGQCRHARGRHRPEELRRRRHQGGRGTGQGLHHQTWDGFWHGGLADQRAEVVRGATKCRFQIIEADAPGLISKRIEQVPPGPQMTFSRGPQHPLPLAQPQAKLFGLRRTDPGQQLIQPLARARVEALNADGLEHGLAFVRAAGQRGLGRLTRSHLSQVQPLAGNQRKARLLDAGVQDPESARVELLRHTRLGSDGTHNRELVAHEEWHGGLLAH